MATRSRSRLAADWFAKLRINAQTQEVEHSDVSDVKEEVDTSVASEMAALDSDKADLSYVNTAIANATMADSDILSAVKRLDGSGSGLDADTLDGLHASSFVTGSHTHDYLTKRSTITYGASHLQWTDLSGTSGTGYNGSTPYNPTNDWYHHIIANHSNSGGYYCDLAMCFHTNNHYITRLANGARTTVKLWNDGNDGSGSGLDADLLDGQHASDIAGADYISSWFNVYSDANYTITHNLGTSNIMALIQIQGLGNGYTILSPSMSYPYYDINKPSGISTWTTSTQVKMRTGRGLLFYRAQSSHSGTGVSYENYSNDPMSIRVLVWKL